MKFSKCFLCDKLIYTPYHVTEIAEDKIESFSLCKNCGQEYMKESRPPSEKVDLSHIKTPEELLGFLTNMKEIPRGIPEETKDPCECGLTLQEFDQHGKFGCTKCYDHFSEVMEQVVYPYHKADTHTGKYPKRQMREMWESNPEEKIKLLKLRYAKAIELEEYEKAGEINKELKELLNQSPPSTFSDL